MERLAGPSTTICWTPNRPSGAEQVSLVRESDLRKLELFFLKPVHQQVSEVSNTIRVYMKEAPLADRQFPSSVFLLNAMRALETAEALLFADFSMGLALTEVHP